MCNEAHKALMAFAALILVVSVGPPAVAGGVPSDEARCLQLLESAGEAMAKAPGHPEPKLQAERGRSAYERAFERCGDPRERSLAVGARVALARGRYLHLYGNDPGGAIAVFEDALRWTAERGGLNHPVRIELLEGLASAIHADAVRRDDSAAIERARQRGLELYREALAVREAAHGAESLEAAEGLVLIAYAHLESQPVLAESYARRAVEIAEEQTGLVHPAAREGLIALERALRQQGRDEEAKEVQDLLDEIPWKSSERGEQPR